MTKLSDIPLSWNGNSFCFKLHVHNALKWDSAKISTSGIFSGSSDRGNTFLHKVACRYVNEIKKYHKVTLYSVIGGCFFYDLVHEVDFDKIVVFDENIAEFGKLAYVLNSLCNDGTNTALGVTKSLEYHVENNPACILPSLGNQYLDIDYSDQVTNGSMYAGFKVNNKSVLLPSDVYPDCTWNANEQQVSVVYERLKKSLVNRIFTRLPNIDAEKSFAVVFISNADISGNEIKKLIKNHSGLLVLRSISVGDFRHIEPHVFWDSVAVSCFQGKTHQCWNSECAKNATNLDLNEFVQSSSFIDDSNVLTSLALIPRDTQTLLTHILLGHGKDGSINKKSRLELIKDILENIPTHIKRLVMAEFNPEGEMSNNVYPFTSIADMKEYFEKFAAKSGLHFTEMRYAPGAQDIKRNVFFIFDRKPQT